MKTYHGNEARKLLESRPSKTPGKGAGLLIHFRTKQTELDYLVRGKRFCGKWKLTVGGAVDNDERFIDCAIREFREEHFGMKIGKLEVSYDVAVFDPKNEYITGQATVLIESEEVMEHYVEALKLCATAAHAALHALTKKVDPVERISLAAKALGNSRFIGQLLLEPHGSAVVWFLQEIEKGRYKDQEIIVDFESEVANTIKVFTEYSTFDIVESHEMLDPEDHSVMFKPESAPVLQLLKFRFK
mmetsp:Transcript_17820/g.21960  ORF Transcript_17820/g.21960 Transcript_17820/m.21960 type:complete len:244 (+) Transcript_17820:621-1352(+)|eukprot:CAMPEP_0204823774 /NCGR_PEP_ID=MMETSP1346-20131115/1845_1 /ASSEMBLY_ACC=CAM_ASM_000771 /TAXON_ID=215587 /ORGANISM="Aplanochytrium stocchinoi, Strain GSBS06" /LENGTH=243 /DNA_ID=CAMNT_0051950563 /DNA_START=627 /DNA_END=1358 /DNA_ORIENTATION=-